MLKICLEKWDKNNKILKEKISKNKNHNNWSYLDIVKLTLSTILSDGVSHYGYKLRISDITEIDNGDYQGTLLYLIPYDMYQPSEGDYLMTYVGYGSCSGCDTLQAIQDYHQSVLPTEEQVNDYMMLCKDIITNIIKPYNDGWRKDDNFDIVEV